MKGMSIADLKHNLSLLGVDYSGVKDSALKQFVADAHIDVARRVAPIISRVNAGQIYVHPPKIKPDSKIPRVRFKF